jgi:peptide/nickel transport system substrate-binding protein
LKHLAIAAAIAISSSISPTTSHTESVLRVRPFGDVKTLDPITNTDYMVRNHGYFVYDTLFGVDDKLIVKPQMVETWQVSPDNKIWTFRLRDGLAFHDGQKVTATDVVASLKRWGARDGLGQQLMAHTEALEVVDPATFRLTLSRPWGLVLDSLGKPSSNVPFIMPARVAATSPDKNIDDPTGSGPFIMKRDEWNAGSRIVYVRNRAYVPRPEPASGFSGGKHAGFDRVQLVILSDM